MAALASKIGPFGEVGGSNREIILEGKLGDNEDPEKESRKEPKKREFEFQCHKPSIIFIQDGSESGHKAIPR